jgi:hypothetical protein
MGRRTFAVHRLGMGFVVAGFVACDLFHSTDFPTLCDLDSSAPGCFDAGAKVIEASPPPPGPTNFCGWDQPTARSHAERACAWLSACESPLGDNDFGPCMVHALLAYDCTANPNRPVRGALHDYWDALWQATSCRDVDRVVFPGAGAADKVPPCASGGGFAACGTAYDGGDNSNVRVECDQADAQARGENCLVQGRTCAAGACVGTSLGSCTMSGCTMASLHDCNEAGIDKGTDCTLFGDGACVANDAGPACASTGTIPCPPAVTVTCSEAGAAQGCPAGTSETIDCTTLTGPGTCSAGQASPAWDVSSACMVDGGVCGLDTCAGTDTLTSCARGQTFATSCVAWSLGECGIVMTVDGPRAACGKPSP